MQTASGYGNRRMLDEVVDVDAFASSAQYQQIVQQQQQQPQQQAVKQERHDDHEINELAAKIVESNKAHLAKLQQQQALQQQQLLRQQQIAGAGALPGANGNGNILNYFNRKASATTATAGTAGGASSSSSGTMAEPQQLSSPTAAEEKKAPQDEESQSGHFGWHTCNKTTHIPYIMRGGEKYCAVRIVETKLLNKYLNYLAQDIYNCTSVRSYYITEAESRLLNEINQKHCDHQFGRELFTHKDLVVRLADVNKFYTFLDVCYRKLMMGNSGQHSEKCGFIRINKESVVPYTVRDNQKYVPLFYFEGETENLKLKADYLSGWDLSYLKFCCKVQGIRNELFASDQVAVISLTDIKSYFPPGIEFEDYWPTKFVDSQLLISKNGGNGNNANGSGAQWTKQPTQPPQKPSWSAATASSAAASVTTGKGGAAMNPTHAMYAAAAAQQLQAQQQGAQMNMTQQQQGRAKQSGAMTNNMAFNAAGVAAANNGRGGASAAGTAMGGRNPSQLEAARMLSNAWTNLSAQEQYQLRMAESNAYAANTLHSLNYNMLRAMQGGAANGAASGQGAPPPLVRGSGQQGGSGRNANAQSMTQTKRTTTAQKKKKTEDKTMTETNKTATKKGATKKTALGTAPTTTEQKKGKRRLAETVDSSHVAQTRDAGAVDVEERENQCPVVGARKKPKRQKVDGEPVKEQTKDPVVVDPEKTSRGRAAKRVALTKLLRS